MAIRQAVIPAAGFGTRMLPAAKVVPKELLPILDRPTIQYVIEEAAGAGIDDVLLITSKGKQTVEDHFHPTRNSRRVFAPEAKNRCFPVSTSSSKKSAFIP